MPPAHQRLHAAGAAPTVELQLEGKFELVVSQRTVQVLDQLQPLSGTRIEGGPVGDAAVASQPLGLRTRLAGGAQQGLAVVAIEGVAAVADARCHVQRDTTHGARLRHRRAQRFHLPRQLGIVTAAQQHAELVAAQARDQAAIAGRGLEALRDRHQQLVADHVAEAVVDQLEAVEVEEARGHQPVTPGDGRIDRPDEVVAVGQAGQRVVAGAECALLGVATTRGDIGHQADVMGDHAAGVRHRAHAHLQPARVVGIALIVDLGRGFLAPPYRLAQCRGGAGVDDLRCTGVDLQPLARHAGAGQAVEGRVRVHQSIGRDIKDEQPLLAGGHRAAQQAQVGLRANPVAHVQGDHQPRRPVPERQQVAGEDEGVEDAAIALAVQPDTMAIGARMRLDLLAHILEPALGQQLGGVEGEELVVAVAVLVHGRPVDLEDRQRLAVEHAGRQRMLLVQEAVLRLDVAHPLAQVPHGVLGGLDAAAHALFAARGDTQEAQAGKPRQRQAGDTGGQRRHERPPAPVQGPGCHPDGGHQRQAVHGAVGHHALAPVEPAAGVDDAARRRIDPGEDRRMRGRHPGMPGPAVRPRHQHRVAGEHGGDAVLSDLVLGQHLVEEPQIQRAHKPPVGTAGAGQDPHRQPHLPGTRCCTFGRPDVQRPRRRGAIGERGGTPARTSRPCTSGWRSSKVSSASRNSAGACCGAMRSYRRRSVPMPVMPRARLANAWRSSRAWLSARVST